MEQLLLNTTLAEATNPVRLLLLLLLSALLTLAAMLRRRKSEAAALRLPPEKQESPSPAKTSESTQSDEPTKRERVLRAQVLEQMFLRRSARNLPPLRRVSSSRSHSVPKEEPSP
jgi:hypothetical protein